jgi:hypothetical protein
MPNPCDHDSEIQPSPGAIETVVETVVNGLPPFMTCFIPD